MSGIEVVSLIVSIAGSVAVIVTLWFVYRQTRIFARQTEFVARTLATSLADNINSQVEQITRLFIEYPEMRPYFYKSQPIEESHADYARAEAIAELVLDALFTISDQAKRSGELRAGQRASGNWLAYVSDSFAQSPILVKFLTERQTWYNEELVELMRLGVQGKSTPGA
jgi:hypothetical protein